MDNSRVLSSASYALQRLAGLASKKALPSRWQRSISLRACVHMSFIIRAQSTSRSHALICNGLLDGAGLHLRGGQNDGKWSASGCACSAQSHCTPVHTWFHVSSEKRTRELHKVRVFRLMSVCTCRHR
eukprot:scaffold61228_cov17-Tisochrysis_lutea.AAC.1